MKALIKVEWIQIWRQWSVFVLAIGMPVGFFLLYSGMQMAPTLEEQKLFVRNYMLTMTAFSMSSFGFFSFPFMLVEDRTSHWFSYIEHSSVPVYYYYLSKIFRVFIYFLCSITVTFLVGKFYRQVSMPVEKWLVSILLLLIASVVFLAFGLLIAQIKSQQLMSIVGNIAFLGLAVLGGSWMPISLFPDWMQSISKVTPTYHVNQLVEIYAQKSQINWTSLLIVLGYAIIIAGLALFIKNKTEVK